MAFFFVPVTALSQTDAAKISQQRPSPMSETVRRHERIQQKEFDGLSFEIPGVLPKTVEVFIPASSAKKIEFDLLIHFLGASYVVKHAADQYKGDIVAAFVHLGAGSKINGDAFRDSTVFPRLLDSLRTNTEYRLGRIIRFKRIILSGWSAGYGAVRQILSTCDNYNRVDAVLLLDGIHASYVPEGRPLAEGGRIDSTHVEAFLKFARDASQTESRHQFLITHSEIFPGTYASTTEATDYFFQQINVKRQAVLEWGPLGMQQISSARQGYFKVLGFAGNTAPDHVDHFHALFHFLNLLAAL
jgi:hypothetical protein